MDKALLYSVLALAMATAICAAIDDSRITELEAEIKRLRSRVAEFSVEEPKGTVT